MTKVKNSDYIEWTQDHVIVKPDETHHWQFCKRCEAGEHIQAVVKHLAPELDISGFKRQSLQYLEHHYYNRFTKGIPKRYLQNEWNNLIAEVKKRLKHLDCKKKG